MVQVQPLDWKFPYAAGVAKKKKRQKYMNHQIFPETLIILIVLMKLQKRQLRYNRKSPFPNIYDLIKAT